MKNQPPGQAKHSLSGFYHPHMLRRNIMIMLPASLVLVGIPFIWTFSAWSIIGWEGLTENWQLIWQFQLLAFCFHVILIAVGYIRESWAHGALLFGYTLLVAKVGFDLMLMPMTATIDRKIYEDVAIFYMAVLLVGVYICIAFACNLLIPTKGLTILNKALLLSILMAIFYPFIRYYKLLSLFYEAELVWMTLVCSLAIMSS